VEIVRGAPSGRATTIGLIITSGLALGLGIVVAVIVASGPQKETVTRTRSTTITVTTTIQAPNSLERLLRPLRRLAPGGEPLPFP
jgi:hypothetical protein